MSKTKRDILHLRGYRVLAECDPDRAEELLAGITAGTLGFEKTYKDKKKGLVAAFTRPGLGELVVKIPRARNRRRWERFLTLFRDGEAFRRFRDFRQLREMGFNCPEAVMAAEKRTSGMVTDGFYVYRFVRGRLADNRDYRLIAPELLRLHRRGYIRRDPKSDNYLIDDDGRVFFIDFKLKKPRILNRVRCVTEYRRFLRYCPEAIVFRDRAPGSRKTFFLAGVVSSYLVWKRRIRHFLKGKLEI